MLTCFRKQPSDGESEASSHRVCRKDRRGLYCKLVGRSVGVGREEESMLPKGGGRGGFPSTRPRQSRVIQ